MTDELELLCTHGILHLLGFDHAEPDERATMFGLQDRLLESWRAERGPGRAAEPGQRRRWSAARRSRASAARGTEANPGMMRWRGSLSPH